MEYLDRLLLPNLAADSQPHDLVQCLDDVLQAFSQKRPLRLAFFIDRLKAQGTSHFSALEAALHANDDPAQLHACVAAQQSFRSKVGQLQQHAIRHELSGEMLEEFRAWLEWQLRAMTALAGERRQSAGHARGRTPRIPLSAFEILEALPLLAGRRRESGESALG